MRTRGSPPLAKPEISRFPRNELPHMPGSWTTPGRAAARAIASVRVAFRAFEHVGTQVAQGFAARWLAYVLPYRRFADTLASANARLRAGADRYSFTVGDFHLLLLAGLPGAPKVLINATANNGGVSARYRCHHLCQIEMSPSSGSGGGRARSPGVAQRSPAARCTGPRSRSLCLTERASARSARRQAQQNRRGVSFLSGRGVTF